MAETLRELVVALSLDSSNFSRNMRTINQQIKKAESTFRLAGAGVENYEKTIAGTEAKLSMLGQKLTQQRAVEQYSWALLAANDKLKENYNRHQDYTQRLEQAKARQEDLRFEVEAANYSVLQEAYQGTTLMNDHMNGEFPRLKPGTNAISWTGAVTKVVVRPNWQYL